MQKLTQRTLTAAERATLDSIRAHRIAKPELIDVAESHGRLEIWTWTRTEHKRIFPPLDAEVWIHLDKMLATSPA